MSFKNLLLLVVASLLIFWSSLIITWDNKESIVQLPRLNETLPNNIAGWKFVDIPVGETEEIRQKIGELLNYDTAIYRRYSKRPIHVEVYISYWARGKEHFRAVNSHTPDVCWTRGGWNSIHRDSEFIFKLGEEPNTEFKIAQYREFQNGNNISRVLFWHLVDGQPFTYGNFGLPPLSAIFSDFLTHGVDQKPEQWFVRVSTNGEFESLKSDTGFNVIMNSLPILTFSSLNI